MGLIKKGLKAAISLFFVKTAVVYERILQRQEEPWAARGEAPGTPSSPRVQPARPADTPLTQLGEARPKVHTHILIGECKGRSRLTEGDVHPSRHFPKGPFSTP